jgi:triosephosphate isomerase
VRIQSALFNGGGQGLKKTPEQKNKLKRLEKLNPGNNEQEEEFWPEDLKQLRTPIMAGNWKCNPKTLEEARTLASLVAANTAEDRRDADFFKNNERGGGGGRSGFNLFNKRNSNNNRGGGRGDNKNVEVLICPPAAFLSEVSQLIEGSGVYLGAQNVTFENGGAFTGEMSCTMADSLGVTHVIIGHSERRSLYYETDEDINKKIKKVIENDMTPVFCVGETKEEYERGDVYDVLSWQLAGGLDGVSAKDVENMIIAYEPVWAIGTGLTATPAIAQSVHKLIRNWIAEKYSKSVADRVRIQYGGSVKPDSVDELMQCPDIDGCLVGGASLSSDDFARICSFHQGTKPGTPRVLYAEECLETQMELGESPVWSQKDQKLYWVDAPRGTLYSWDLLEEFPDMKESFGETLGCCALMSNGDLILGLASGLYQFDPRSKTVKTRLTDFEPGLNTRPNDGRVDRSGNFIIGSYNNDHRVDASAIGGLWRLDANNNRQLEEVLDYKHRCSNCICFSPDGRKMYFTDTPRREVFEFDYDPNRGPLNRRLFYSLPSDMAGGPDGAQVDAVGNLWIAISGAGKCIRVDKNTNMVDLEVRLPVSSPTSLTFCGNDCKTLVITTRKKENRKDAGSLFSVRIPDIGGLPEPEYGSSPIIDRLGFQRGGRNEYSNYSNNNNNNNQDAFMSNVNGYAANGINNVGSKLNGVNVERRFNANNTANQHELHEPEFVPRINTATAARSSVGVAKFCERCGCQFSSAASNFCSQCGTPRAS